MVAGVNLSDPAAKQASLAPARQIAMAPALIDGMRDRLAWLRQAWNALSLSLQFIIASSAVIITAMALLGAWVSSRIEAGVVQNTGISTAYYMDSLLAPVLQPLAKSPEIDPTVYGMLDAVLTTKLGTTFAAIQIWNLDGKIVYSTNRSLEGMTERQPLGFRAASTNQITSEFDDREEAGRTAGATFDRPVLAVYTPIHEFGTNRVIGVAEMVQFADGLKASIAKNRWTTFAVVGTSTLCMLTLLFRIVQRGSQTIDGQRKALQTQVANLSHLLEQNEELNRNVAAGRKMTTVTNERLLRRIGADLHDGPSQLIGLALLYYDSLDPSQGGGTAQTRSERFEKVRGLLQDSLGEIRHISADIAPPHLKKLTPTQTVELAIRNHERRTGAAVETAIQDMIEHLDCGTKICLYRFVQEGLNNTFRHAKGSPVIVTVRRDDHMLVVDIADRGPGIQRDPAMSCTGLGLTGLRDRFEACGGTLEVHSQPGQGTRLVAQFVLASTTGIPS